MLRHTVFLVLTVIVVVFGTTDFVFGQSNITIPPTVQSPIYATQPVQPVVQPVIQPGVVTPAPTVAGVDAASIVGIAGAIFAIINAKKDNKKQDEERHRLEQELKEKEKELDQVNNGALMLAKISNQMAMSLKATDKGDERFARIFYLFVTQLAKNEILKPVLTEKIKTTDTDLFVNNKSIVEIAQNNYEHMVNENKLYYENLQPTLNDTCENRIIKSISLVDKMTTRG